MGKQRLVGLDLFRISSAAIILAFHTWGHLQCYYGILNNFVSMGAIMMTGFFMLSGFSLYHTYQGKDLQSAKNIGSFYKKRMIGILPLYYVVGLIYCVFSGTESFVDTVFLAPMELLCLQSYCPSTFNITHNGGTWFVSCIMACYIVFPFVKELVVQLKFRTQICAMLLAAGILLYFPIVVWYFDLPSIYSNPFIRILEFLIGILLAAVFDRIKEIRVVKDILFSKRTILLEGVLLIAGVSLLYYWEIECYNYLLYLWICLPVFMVMIPGLAGASFPKLQGSGVLLYASETSYAFFLAQLLLYPNMRKWYAFTGINHNIFKIVSAFIYCSGLAILLHELIEKPCKKVLKSILHI